MNVDDWIELLKTVIPVLVLAIPGGFALWRVMTQEQTRKRQIEAEASENLRKYKLAAEEAAWKRASNTIEDQDKQIEMLQEKVKDWRQQFEESRKAVKLLEEKIQENETCFAKQRQKITELIARADKCHEELEERDKAVTNLQAEMSTVLLENHSLRTEMAQYEGDE